MDKFTLGFYNIENLFDVFDDKKILDEQFTVHAPREWNASRYKNKIHKIARAITEIGLQTSGTPPVLLGLAEVENESVLKDLIKMTELDQYQYNYIHFDSPDERGIDVALLYRTNYFMVTQKIAHTVYIEDEFGVRDTTRDILQVHGYLQDEPLHLLITHWPSKRDNDINAPKRLEVAKKIKELIDQIFEQDPYANLVVMGDFNEEPNGNSIRNLGAVKTVEELQGNMLYNPMIQLKAKGRGTLTHKGQWSLFDQLMFSKSLVKGFGRLSLEEANVFDAEFLKEWSGPYKGQPFRTYIGNQYIGGYSDHFPVFAVLGKR